MNCHLFVFNLAVGNEMTVSNWLETHVRVPEDRNQMFWPIFARGPWPEAFKASFSRTNQTANKRGRQKKCVKIFIFTYLHKTPPGQKTAGNFPNFFEGTYSPHVGVSRFGCRFEYLMVSRS